MIIDINLSLYIVSTNSIAYCGEINLTPNNDFENKVGILLDNSITNKSNFNVQELFPKVFDQCKVMPIIDYINYENIKIDQNTIDCLIDFLEKNIIVTSLYRML